MAEIDEAIGRLRGTVRICRDVHSKTASVMLADLALLLSHVEAMRSDAYLIWSNQHRAWWRANSHGYTVHLETAGRYSREEALKICASAHDGWEKEKAPPEIPVVETDAVQCSAPERTVR